MKASRITAPRKSKPKMTEVPIIHHTTSGDIRMWNGDPALAHWIYGKGPGWRLADMAGEYAGFTSSPPSMGAAYLRIERCLPFEIKGMVFHIDTYNGHKSIHASPGRLENYPPNRPERSPASRPKLKTMVDEAVDKRMREVEGWLNVAALRKEAWAYMQGVEKRLEARIELLEKGD